MPVHSERHVPARRPPAGRRARRAAAETDSSKDMHDVTGRNGYRRRTVAKSSSPSPFSSWSLVVGDCGRYRSSQDTVRSLFIQNCFFKIRSLSILIDQKNISTIRGVELPSRRGGRELAFVAIPTRVTCVSCSPGLVAWAGRHLNRDEQDKTRLENGDWRMGLHATIAVPRWLMRTSDAWPAGERGELAVHGLGLQVGAGVLQNLKSAGIACCPVE